jgi:hypothetical protein
MKISMILILPLLVAGGLYAQEKQGSELPRKGDQISFSNIVQVDNTSKEELHRRAGKWAAYTCDAVTLNDDDEVVANGILFLNLFSQDDIRYTIKVKVKDSRYKYEITNLRVRSRYPDTAGIEYPIEDYIIIGKKKFEKVAVEQINKEIIESLEQVMKTSEDDTW